jgi:peptidyl-prolyl cis-trans isomerase C
MASPVVPVASDNVSHEVNPAGSQPRGALRWGYFLVLNAIAGVIAVGIFIAIFYADVSLAETTVVATVGPRKITVDELTRRMAAVQPFLLRDYGHNADEVRRNFLERVLIREALFVQAALDRKLAERTDVKERINGALRSGMLTAVRDEVIQQSPVTEEEIKQYYKANWSKFHTPARVAISRILLATREEAVELLKDFQAAPSPQRWAALAREKSLDKLTAMQGGNFGFVTPEGATDDPGLRVDVALMNAAALVQNGQLVSEPIKEGDRYAVIWRRSSEQALERPLENEMSSIRGILTHSKVDKHTTLLLEQLRKDHVTDVDPTVLDLLDIGSSGKLHPSRRPGVLSPQKPSAPPAPRMPGGHGGVR